MPYEEMDYEVILDSMIDTVEDLNPDLDTREGSLIFNAIAACALEIAILYSEMENVQNESFVDTASREYLLLKCKELGIDDSRFEATAGIHLADFNAEVAIGSRWNCDVHNFVVTDFVANVDGYYTYRLQCETLGSDPNHTVGDLTTLDDDNIDVMYAVLSECVIQGEDEASEDVIREAYYKEVNDTARDGNKAQYENWCEEFKGIGNYKVTGDKNGVSVRISNASNGVASPELIAEFQNYLDPGSTGMGDGVAPIGAVVTVSTGEEKSFDFSANIILENGYTNLDIVTDAVGEYLKSIVFKDDYIYLLKLASHLINTPGIANISNLKINGTTGDVALSVSDIPVVGTTQWTEGL